MRHLSSIIGAKFTQKSLRDCVRVEDLRRFHIKNKADLDVIAARAASNLLRTDYQIPPLNARPVASKKSIYEPPDYDTLLILRQTDRILREALRHTPPNRAEFVESTLRTLQTEPSAKVLRTDISSFFESLSFEQIIESLRLNGLRSSGVLRILTCINRQLLAISPTNKGLPRGLAISSTLSDYALREFDRNLRSTVGVIYYARYVDDIVIIHHNETSTIEDLVVNNLNSLNLSINIKKTSAVSNKSNKSFEYLGYSITLAEKISVGIGKTKLNKIKCKLAIAFSVFCKDGDFDALTKRLRFLIFQTRIRKKNRLRPIYIGLKSTYQSCDMNRYESDLGELDKFMQGLITSKRCRVGKQLRASIGNDTPKYNYLRSMSFVGASRKGVFTSLAADKVIEITKVWANAH